MSTGRDLLLSRTSEHAFQEHVLTTAARGGFHGIHIRQSHNTLEALHSPRRAFPRGADHDDAWGAPDLLLINPTRGLCIFAELKRDRGRVRPGQQLWASWLQSVTRVEYHLWRPSDERDVERVLLG